MNGVIVTTHIDNKILEDHQIFISISLKSALILVKMATGRTVLIN
jgi:hypothetical protein